MCFDKQAIITSWRFKILEKGAGKYVDRSQGGRQKRLRHCIRGIYERITRFPSASFVNTNYSLMKTTT